MVWVLSLALPCAFSVLASLPIHVQMGVPGRPGTGTAGHGTPSSCPGTARRALVPCRAGTTCRRRCPGTARLPLHGPCRAEGTTGPATSCRARAVAAAAVDSNPPRLSSPRLPCRRRERHHAVVAAVFDSSAIASPLSRTRTPSPSPIHLAKMEAGRGDGDRSALDRWGEGRCGSEPRTAKARPERAESGDARMGDGATRARESGRRSQMCEESERWVRTEEGRRRRLGKK